MLSERFKQLPRKKQLTIIGLLLLLFIGFFMASYDLYTQRQQINDTKHSYITTNSYYEGDDKRYPISKNVLKNITLMLNQSLENGS